MVLLMFLKLPSFRQLSDGGEFPVDAVNRSKQLCFQVARDLHGAGGLPAPWWLVGKLTVDGEKPMGFP